MPGSITKGVFPLPKTLNSPLPGRIYYWFRKNDKTSQKIRDALKKHAVPLSTVTMKKLRRGKALMDQRPDMAVGLLEKAFGDGVTVTLSDTLPDSPENVWRELSLFPAGGETAVLTKLEPIRCEDDDRVQILEGSSKRLRMWSHMIRLEDAGEDKTRVVDQVELDASRLNVLAKPLAALYLREQQLRRRLALKSGRHAL